MAKESQYLHSYLNENDSREYGKGITPGTFLAYRLRGRAKSYSGGYLRALVSSLERRRTELGDIVRVRSHGGGIAYQYKKNS